MTGIWIELIGTVAGALGMVGFVPQVIQTVRRRTAGDLNGMTLAIFAVNTALWTFYGFVKHAWALGGSDLIVLLLIAILAAYKLRDRLQPASPNRLL